MATAPKPYMDISLAYGKMTAGTDTVTLTTVRVEAPFNRQSAATSAKNRVSKVWVDATSNGKLGGGFMTETVSHPEGTVIMIQATRIRRKMRSADAAVLIRLRRGAPQQMIQLRLPIAGNSLLGEYISTMQGMFDIIPLREAAALGLVIPLTTQREYFNKEEVDSLFRVIELAGGSPRPGLMVTTNERGEEEVMEIDRPRQRMITPRRRRVS